MKTFSLLSLMLLFCISAAHAQFPTECKSSETSGVEFYTSNNGIFGLNTSTKKAGFIYPRGSNKSYIFGSGLWFCTRKFHVVDGKDSLIKMSEMTYNPNSGASWATAKSVLSRSVNGNTELYTCSFSDEEIANFEISAATAQKLGYPIGLSFDLQTSGWSSGPFISTVINRYTIINTSNDTLYNCVIAPVADCDIGAAANDHAAILLSQPALRTMYAWTNVETGQSYGAVGITLLESPIIDINGYIDNSRRKDYKEQGRLQNAHVWTLAEDPNSPEARYDFMNSVVLSNNPATLDVRVIMNDRSFTMRPHDTAHIAIAYYVLNAGTQGQPDTVAVTNMASTVTDYYYTTLVADAPDEQRSSTVALSMIPNPVTGTASIRFSNSRRGDVALSLTNTLGQTVWSETLRNAEPGTHQRTIDCSSLPNGMYVLNAGCDNRLNAVRVIVMNK